MLQLTHSIRKIIFEINETETTFIKIISFKIDSSGITYY